MIVKLSNASLLKVVSKDFIDKATGKKIDYHKAFVSIDEDVFEFSIASDIVSTLRDIQGSEVSLNLDLRFQNNQLKAKIVAIALD